MTTHQSYSLPSAERWFDHIEAGTKTIEGRLWFGVEIGDTIEFFYRERRVIKKVTSVAKFSCFPEMLVLLGIERILPGVTEQKEASEIFQQWFPMALQRKKEVVAIGLGPA